MVNLSRDVKMALGLSAGLRHGISLFSSLDKTSDPLFAQNEQILYTMFGAGAMIFSDKFYVGVSLPQLINLKIKDHNNGIKGNRFFNYLYLTGGMLIPLSDQIDLKPNTLLWYSEDMKPQLDLNLNVILQKKLWVGVSWRSLESISGMFQIQIDKKLQVGYAYDAGTSISRTVSKGSHELLLSYRFMKNRRRVISTRWF
jgi:type IX secretion system PorP/SprF family membrane protein